MGGLEIRGTACSQPPTPTLTLALYCLFFPGLLLPLVFLLSGYGQRLLGLAATPSSPCPQPRSPESRSVWLDVEQVVHGARN